MKKPKERYVLGIGYAWGMQLIDDGMTPTAIKLKTIEHGCGEDIPLKHLGKWGGWKKYRLVLESLK